MNQLVTNENYTPNTNCQGKCKLASYQVVYFWLKIDQGETLQSSVCAYIHTQLLHTYIYQYIFIYPPFVKQTWASSAVDKVLSSVVRASHVIHSRNDVYRVKTNWMHHLWYVQIIMQNDKILISTIC